MAGEVQDRNDTNNQHSDDSKIMKDYWDSFIEVQTPKLNKLERNLARKDHQNLVPDISLWIIQTENIDNMNRQPRIKIHIPKVFYQSFIQPNRLLSTTPTRLMVIKRVNRLKKFKKDILNEEYHYIEISLDIILIEDQITRLHNYLNLLSCC